MKNFPSFSDPKTSVVDYTQEFRHYIDEFGGYDTRRERYKAAKEQLGDIRLSELDTHIKNATTQDNFNQVFSHWAPVLDDWNRFDLSLPWFKDAFRYGISPYLVSDIIVRVWNKLGADDALNVCEELLALIEDIEFKENGDAFHVGMAKQILEGFPRVIAYEAGNGEPPNDVANGLHDAVRCEIWPRIWQLARLQKRTEIGRMACLYPFIYNHDALQSLFAVESFLATYGFWQEAKTVLQNAIIQEDTAKYIIAAILTFQMEAGMQTHDLDGAQAYWAELLALIDEADLNNFEGEPELARYWTKALWFRYRYFAYNNNSDALETLRNRVSSQVTTLSKRQDDAQDSDLFVQLSLLLAHMEEDRGRLDEAKRLYISRSSDNPGGYLPASYWRASVFLSGADHWNAAATLQQNGALELWKFYDAFARIPPEERQEKDCILPEKAVMLNCDGIGDDLWRIIITLRIIGFDKSYAFVVDDRLKPALQRALPHCEFLTRSSGAGSHAVDVRTFHKDRMGVHSSLELVGLTREIADKVEEYGDVCLGEDAYVEYFRRMGEFENAYQAPVLKADDRLLEKARKWLSTLPQDNLNIGISWRTGVFNVIGSLNHFQIKDLEDVLKTGGINWVLLQYLVDPEELMLARETFGIELHHMPDLDLKDDIDQIVAITSLLDHVLASPSTIEPLSAASGTPVTTLGTGYYSVNRYRLALDGETDRVIPHIKLLTPSKFGDKAGIVTEAKRRIEALVELNIVNNLTLS